MSKPKRLYRSKKDRMIAGVCGGLGEYFGIDPVLLRIAFVILIFFSGSGLILYFILAVVIPNEPERKREVGEEGKLEGGIQDITDGTKKIAEEVAKGAETVVKSLPEQNEWLSERRNILGLILIVVGLLALANQLFPGFFNWNVFWPLALVFLGIYIILKG